MSDVQIPLVVQALGVAVNVTGLSPAEATQFSAAWSRCLLEEHAPAAVTVQRINGDFARADEHLTSTITLRAIDQLAGSHMMFHACGLAEPASGATTAFIAPSGTGKTTLARTLGPGMLYISDETIAVRQDLSIVPYPKPLSIKQTEAGLPKRQTGPDELGLGPTHSAPFLRSIALLNRQDETTVVALDRVPMLEAILELTPQLSALPRMDRGLVRLCRLIDACGGVTRISYSEAASLHEILPQLALAPETSEGTVWTALEIAIADAGQPTPGSVRRAAVTDAVQIDGVTVVLAGTNVVNLGPLGALIWDMSGTWLDPRHILEQTIDAIGEHPSAAELVDAALAELLNHGILERA